MVTYQNILETNDISEYFGAYRLFGTFKACPQLFVELYTIIGDVGSTEDTTKVVPLIFGLLSDKKQTNRK